MSKAKDKIGFEGKYKIKIIRGGKIVHESQGKNLVVDSGLNIAANRIFIGGTVVGFMAIGSGTIPPVPGNIALESEHASTRNAATSATVTLNQATLEFTLVSPGAITMTEMGLFDAIVAGNMFSRFLTQAVSLELDDQITLTWILQITGA